MINYVFIGLDDGGLMIDEVAELRSQLEREQNLRVELEEQVKVYSARLGEVFVDQKPIIENTQTTIQYHHNTNTVRGLYPFGLIVLIFFYEILNFETIFFFYILVCGRRGSWYGDYRSERV